jgi:hypothetical protein
MADVVKKIEYYYTMVPDRAGAGAKVLDALKKARVSLVAFAGFPIGVGRAQLDFVPSNQRAFTLATGKAKIKVVGPKTAFLIQGQDRTGAIADLVSKLAEARINVTAVHAIAAGQKRYGAILWVKPRNIKRAAEVLGVS